MMWLMEGFKRLFAEKDLTIRWLRNVGMKSVDKLTPIKNQMIKLAMGLDS
jgi:2-octaprenylphenol hydroxylase